VVPVINIPISEKQSREDRIVLSLHYRWALQALSALGFMHSKSVNIKIFDSANVWLRSDYSLALTGFICAWAPEIEKRFRADGRTEIKRQEKEERENQAWMAGVPVEDIVEKTATAEESGDEDEDCGGGIPWDEGEWVGSGNFNYDDVHEASPEERASVQEDL
jgi:hypothetical protein